jgi:hypothetical protein
LPHQIFTSPAADISSQAFGANGAGAEGVVRLRLRGSAKK